MSNRSPDAPVASVPTQATRSPDFKRRRFLCALGAGSAGAATLATQAVAAPIISKAVAVDADVAKGYRETEHIRDYYATTRI
jgi:hypothetical protein